MTETRYVFSSLFILIMLLVSQYLPIISTHETVSTPAQALANSSASSLKHGAQVSVLDGSHQNLQFQIKRRGRIIPTASRPTGRKKSSSFRNQASVFQVITLCIFSISCFLFLI